MKHDVTLVSEGPSRGSVFMGVDERAFSTEGCIPARDRSRSELDEKRADYVLALGPKRTLCLSLATPAFRWIKLSRDKLRAFPLIKRHNFILFSSIEHNHVTEKRFSIVSRKRDGRNIFFFSHACGRPSKSFRCTRKMVFPRWIHQIFDSLIESSCFANWLTNLKMKILPGLRCFRIYLVSLSNRSSHFYLSSFRAFSIKYGYESLPDRPIISCINFFGSLSETRYQGATFNTKCRMGFGIWWLTRVLSRASTSCTFFSECDNCHARSFKKTSIS